MDEQPNTEVTDYCLTDYLKFADRSWLTEKPCSELRKDTKKEDKHDQRSDGDG
jgi:hypothetical protein